MNGSETPILDSRSTQDFYAELTAVQPAFVPELPPAPEGTTAALVQILARFSSIVVQRLNQAPDLDELGFLDMLGINLIPAQPARAPLVFTPLPLIADGHISPEQEPERLRPAPAVPRFSRPKTISP